MEDQRPSDRYIGQVVAAYAAAEQMLLIQAAKILRQAGVSFTGQWQALSALRNLVRRTVQQLTAFDPLARDGIALAGVEGRERANRDGGGGGNTPPPPAPPARDDDEPFDLSMPHGERAAQAIADDVVSNLEDVRRRITRLPDDIYKLISPQAAMGQVIDNGVRPEEAQAVAWRVFTERGVTGFVDKSGRNWSLSAYVEMSVRTAAMRAFNDSHLQTMRALGIRYFTVAPHKNPCPLCFPWAGTVLVEALPERPAMHVDATIEQAVSAGLFHPNCRHVLIPVFPGVTVLPDRTPWTAELQAEYDATQRQRALEREIRKAKQAERDALTDAARAKARKDVRRWQAAIREHVAAHDAARDSRREQVNMRQDRNRPAPTAPSPRAGVSHAPSGQDARARELRLTPGVDRPGRVEIPDGLHLEAHEISTARRLAAVGINVRWNEIIHGDHVKNLDVTIDGEPWEIKSPQGAGKSTISNQLHRAKEQGATRIVIDTARTPLDDTAVLNEMRRRFAHVEWWTSMIHIARDGTVTRFTR